MNKEMINKAVESVREMIERYFYFIENGFTHAQIKEIFKNDYGFVRGTKVLLEVM